MSQTCVFESHEKFYGSQEHVQDDELFSGVVPQRVTPLQRPEMCVMGLTPIIG